MRAARLQMVGILLMAGCQMSNPYLGLRTKSDIETMPPMLAAAIRQQKAKELEKEGAWRAALLETEKAYQADPHLPGISTQYGRLLARAGEEEKAAYQLEHGFARSPKDVDARYELGKFLAKREQLDAAELHLREATRMDPAFAAAWYELGKVCVRKDNPGGALEAFRQIQPDHEATYNVAILLIRERKEESAKELLEAAASMDEKFEKPKVILARMRAPGGAGQPSLVVPAALRTAD